MILCHGLQKMYIIILYINVPFYNIRDTWCRDVIIYHVVSVSRYIWKLIYERTEFDRKINDRPC